jgi:hypothetical protein
MHGAHAIKCIVELPGVQRRFAAAVANKRVWLVFAARVCAQADDYEYADLARVVRLRTHN